MGQASSTPPQTGSGEEAGGSGGTNAEAAGNNAVGAPPAVDITNAGASLNAKENALAASASSQLNAAANAESKATSLREQAANSLQKKNEIVTVKKKIGEQEQIAAEAKEGALAAQQDAVEKSAAVADIAQKAKVGNVAGALAASNPNTKKFSWMSWACCGAVICAIVAAVMIGWGSHDLGAKEKGTTGYNTAIAAVATGIFILLCAACTVKMAD